MKKKRLLTDRSGDLMDRILDDKAQAMANDIDREVLWGMLEGMGWTRVMIPTLTDNMHAIDIGYWLDANCKNSFERNGRDFLFEDIKDANWFKLRWLVV
jgi:hypothetical protein